MRIVKFLLLMIVLLFVAASTQTLPLYAECDEGDYCTIYQWYTQPGPEEEKIPSDEVCANMGVCDDEGCSLRDSGFNTGVVWCRCNQGCSECNGGEASIKASIERASPTTPADLFIQGITPAPARVEK